MLGGKIVDYTMKDGTSYSIKRAEKEHWDEATEMAFKVFLKYEAPQYGKEGTQKFVEFLTSVSLHRLFLQGFYKMYVATVDEEIIGIISYRNGNHISLLFVDDRYHKMGVGRELIKTVQNDILASSQYEIMTVHASPYGVPFYKRVGFVATDEEQYTDGIIYTPMEMYL